MLGCKFQVLLKTVLGRDVKPRINVKLAHIFPKVKRCWINNGKESRGFWELLHLHEKRNNEEMKLQIPGWMRTIFPTLGPQGELVGSETKVC